MRTAPFSRQTAHRAQIEAEFVEVRCVRRPEGLYFSCSARRDRFESSAAERGSFRVQSRATFAGSGRSPIGRGCIVSKPALIAVGLAALATAAGGLQAAEEPAPSTFVSLKLDGVCDDQNQRLWLINTHTFKTVAATVRWRAAGGKDLTDRFFPAPNSVREIGCAAEGEILEAAFAEF